MRGAGGSLNAKKKKSVLRQCQVSWAASGIGFSRQPRMLTNRRLGSIKSCGWSMQIAQMDFGIVDDGMPRDRSAGLNQLSAYA